MALQTETVTITITGKNPQTQTVKVLVDPATGAGQATFSYSGTNRGNDTIVATATIAGQSLTSNTAGVGWQVPDVPDNGSYNWDSRSYGFNSFVIIAVFPDGTHTGPSQVINADAHKWNLIWDNTKAVAYGASYLNVYETYPSGYGLATYGKLHGIGSKNTGQGPNLPTSTTQIVMDDGDWYKWQGDGTAAPTSNTTASVPPTSTETGKLVLTPSGGAGNVKSVGTNITLTVKVSGIQYQTLNYVPVLEGQTGQMTITNGGGTFSFQQYNGQTVDKATAASKVFQLTSDNGKDQGRLSVSYDGTNFLLKYNGNAIDANVERSTVSLQDDDIAWYNSTNKSFDLFTPSTQGGGDIFQMEVDWMVKPTASLNPITVNADGKTYNLSVSLSKPFPPTQQGAYSTGNSINITASLSGGGSLNNANITPITNNGWLTGWTIPITAPTSVTNVTLGLSVNISGTLTYLKGTSFVTETVSYVNGQIATITANGSSYSPPQSVSFTVSTGVAVSSNFTMTAKFFSRTNDPFSVQFTLTPSGTNTPYNLGTAVSAGSGTPGTFNGQTGYIYTVTSASFAYTALDVSPGDYLGYKATDQTSGQYVTYNSAPTAYYDAPDSSSAGGGGFGSGCFTEEVGIEVPLGLAAFGTLPKEGKFEINTKSGVRSAELVVHENYKGWMIELAPNKLVTLDHLMGKDGEPVDWTAANEFYSNFKRVWFEGTVYNLHVDAEGFNERHYILFNGDVAHNLKEPTVDWVQ